MGLKRGFSLLITVLSCISIFAQNQDCSNAELICDGTAVITDTGNSSTSTTLPDPNCWGGYGANNQYWYTFTIAQAGDFGFNLVSGIDYDWALYNITGTGNPCDFSAEVGCNWSGSTAQSVTGMGCGAANAACEDFLSVNVGESFVLLINNWGGGGPPFTLSFTGDAVIGAPIIDFEAEPVCNGQPTQFTNNGGSSWGYTWDFDGLGTSTDYEPTFTFPAPGVYDVTLTANVATSACLSTNMITLPVTVGEGPQINFDQPTYNICAGDTLCPDLTILIDPTPVELDFCSSGNIPIATGGFTNDIINVSGVSNMTMGPGTLVSVCVDMNIPNLNQLAVNLFCPDGTPIFLFGPSQASGNLLDQTCFTPVSTTPLSSGFSPYSGDFAPFPATPFSTLDGCSTNGDWIISINNALGTNPGTLVNWCISFMSDNSLESVDWSDPTAVGPDPENPCIINGNGIYDVTVTDVIGCTTTNSFEIIQSAIGDPAWTVPASPCIEDLPITLNPDNDFSGVWSGTGITDNGNGTSSFAPAMAGTYDVTYCVGSGSCATCEMYQISTQATEVSAFTINTNYCDQDPTNPMPTLLPGTATGGTYTSNPAIAIDPNTGELIGIGVQAPGTIIEVIYTTSGLTGCTSSSSEFIEVIAIPDADFNTLPAIVCQDDLVVINLTPNIAGGTFSGNGVAGNIFDPSLLAPGTTTINISYALSVNGCSNSSSQTFTIGLQEAATFSIANNALCADDPSVPTPILDPAATPGGFWTINFGSINATTGQIDMGSILSGNVYTVSYQTTGACLDSFSEDFIINANPDINLISQTNASCNQNNGTAIVSINTGVNPYTAIWYDSVGGIFSNTDNLNGAAADSYTLSITDDVTGCETIIPVNIVDDGAPSLSQDAVTEPSCGGSNGSIAVSTVGGQGTLTYSWSQDPTLNSSTANNLPAASYTVTVTDANNCSTNITIVLTDDGAPAIDNAVSIVTDANCSVAADGSILGSIVTGGDGNYTYSWENSYGIQIGTNADISGLAAGDYTLIVLDGNNCTDSYTFTINNANNAPTITNATITDANCGSNSGALTAAIISGGGANVVMYWEDAAGVVLTGTSAYEDLTNISAGSYTLFVVDDSGCEDQMTFTVPGTSALDIIDGTLGNASCGQDDGSITGITVNGGDGNYTYEWSDASGVIASTLDISNLFSGTYTLSIIDGDGCTESISYPISDADGPTLAGVVSSESTCGDSNGTLIGGTAAGGAGPYTYEWTDITGLVIGSNSDISGLSSGDYTLSVEDYNGCTVAETYTIADIAGPTIMIGTSTDANCGQPDGSILSTSIQGGTGTIDFSWTNDLYPGVEISNGADLTAVAAGNYTLSVTDDNGCTDIYSIAINDSGNVSFAGSTVDDATCGMMNGAIYGGSASGGNLTYTYTWTDVSGSVVAGSPNDPDWANIAAGIYTLTVEDGNGCTVSETYTVSDIGGPSINLANVTDANCGYSDGAIDNVSINASGAVNFEWSDASGIISNDSTLVGLDAGTYTLIITDANNCTATETFTIGNIGSVLDPTFTFYTNSYCMTESNPVPDYVASPGGQYTAPAGLSISSTTGEIDLASSAAGVYIVSYETAPPCPATATFSVTITDIETVAFTYDASSYCADGNNPLVTSASIPTAVFFSNDFTVDPISGEIDLYGITAPFTGTVYSSTNSACSDTTATIIDIVDAISADFSFQTLAYCLSDPNPTPISIDNPGSFSASGGLIIDPTTGEIDLASAGTGGTFDLTYTSSGACPSTVTQTVTISDFLDASFDYLADEYCASDVLSPSAINVLSAGGTFSIDNGMSIDPSTGEIDMSAASSDVTAMVTYTTPGSCGDQTSQIVTIYATPEAVFDLAENTCADALTTITIDPSISSAYPNGEFIWNFGDANVLSGSGAGPYELSWTETGLYTVGLQVNNGICSSEPMDLQIEVIDLEIETEADIAIVSGANTVLNSSVNFSGDLAYVWTPEAGLSCTDCPSPTASPTETTQYMVQVTDLSSGCTALADILIEVDFSEIFIPNSFTPNNDGLNDEFTIYGGQHSDVLLRIYNRWGELLFESNDPQNGWDGRYQNLIQNPGVYVYTLNFRYLDGKTGFRKGNVTLVN